MTGRRRRHESRTVRALAARADALDALLGMEDLGATELGEAQREASRIMAATRGLRFDIPQRRAHGAAIVGAMARTEARQIAA